MPKPTLEERVNTLSSLAATLIDCIAVLAKAQVDPEVGLDIATKLGAFVISEKRPEDAE